MKPLQNRRNGSVSARLRLLDLFWVAGLCFGFALGRFCRAFPVPEVFASGQAGLLAVVLPLVLGPMASFLLALVFPWQILLAVAFLRGSVLTYVWCVLWGTFQPVGWVLSPILLLAELFMTPILFFLWLRLLPGSPGDAVSVLLVCLAFAAAAGFVSYCLVMPLSAFLIDGVFGGVSP